jgi:hypothetical protein
LESYAFDVANLKGQCINLRLMTPAPLCRRMQCWCLLQFEVEDACSFDIGTKWLKTRRLSRHVAIRRQVPDRRALL